MQDKLKQLSHFKTAAFAVWPFDTEADHEELHADTVILGLNPSKEVAFGKNFHGGRFDLWYEEAFSKPPFAGAFMTDLMFYHEPDSTIVIKKWSDDQFKNDHITELKKQFSILAIQPKTHILCIGKNTEELFTAAFSDFTSVWHINHPNSYRMKGKRQKFVEDIEKIGHEMHLRRFGKVM